MVGNVCLSSRSSPSSLCALFLLTLLCLPQFPLRPLLFVRPLLSVLFREKMKAEQDYAAVFSQAFRFSWPVWHRALELHFGLTCLPWLFGLHGMPGVHDPCLPWLPCVFWPTWHQAMTRQHTDKALLKNVPAGSLAGQKSQRLANATLSISIDRSALYVYIFLFIRQTVFSCRGSNGLGKGALTGVALRRRCRLASFIVKMYTK